MNNETITLLNKMRDSILLRSENDIGTYNKYAKKLNIYHYLFYRAELVLDMETFFQQVKSAKKKIPKVLIDHFNESISIINKNPKLHTGKTRSLGKIKMHNGNYELIN